MTVILGVDPGSRVTGYGIIEQQAGRCIYRTSGCIRLKDAPLAERLRTIHDCLNALIQEHRPTCMAVEQVFVGKNASSALKLGHARGATILVAALQQLPVSEYAPRAIKQAVAGTGAANKEQVQQMVVRLLGLSSAPAADAADALAAALCHAHSAPVYQQLAQVPVYD